MGEINSDSGPGDHFTEDAAFQPELELCVWGQGSGHMEAGGRDLVQEPWSKGWKARQRSL